jgi:probable rRNA maturation factor
MSLPQPEEEVASVTVDVDFSIEEGIDGTWDEPSLTALVRSIVGRELPAGDWAMSLYLVGDETIRGLNAEHRGIDTHTDVLSFPLYDPNGMGFVLPPGEPANLGDVVVSFPTAVKQAHAFGHAVEREIGYLVAHGVLHVLGYDHEKDADRRRMRELEEEALRPLGLTR